jgi:hypothetical protein
LIVQIGAGEDVRPKFRTLKVAASSMLKYVAAITSFCTMARSESCHQRSELSELPHRRKIA